MGTDIIPYEPYHPHLGYTLVISCLAYLSVALYSNYFLKQHPRLRVLLYGLAIALPIYAEGMSYILFLVRPAPDTPIGYFLSHFHAEVIERYPLDSFLSPAASTLLIMLLSGLASISILRFLVGTLRLNRMLSSGVPLAETPYKPVLTRLLSLVKPQYGVLPPIWVCNIAVPLAFTTGIARPRVYVSSALLQTLNTDEAVAVLCHEWAHVQRRDTLWNWLVRLLRDTLWFLPGSHFAWSAMIASQDEACDALAANMTRQPLNLARALVKVASTKPKNRSIPLRTTNSFVRFGAAPRVRVEQMIQMSQDSGRPGRASAIGAVLLAAWLLVAAVLPTLLGS